jgi:hypothetical protein
VDNSLFLSFWTRTGEWEFVIHGRHSDKGQRHVHVRRIRKRKGEYSWNIDGSRHDVHKFPENDKGIVRAKEIAAQRLKVDPSVLTFVTSFSYPDHVHVISPYDPAPTSYTIFRPRGDCILLTSDDWAIIMSLPQSEQVT